MSNVKLGLPLFTRKYSLQKSFYSVKLWSGDSSLSFKGDASNV